MVVEEIFLPTRPQERVNRPLFDTHVKVVKNGVRGGSSPVVFVCILKRDCSPAKFGDGTPK